MPDHCFSFKAYLFNHLAGLITWFFRGVQIQHFFAKLDCTIHFENFQILFPGTECFLGWYLQEISSTAQTSTFTFCFAFEFLHIKISCSSLKIFEDFSSPQGIFMFSIKVPSAYRYFNQNTF